MRDDAVLGRALPLDRGLGPMEDLWLQVKAEATIQILHPLLEKVLSVPATSAPVAQVFSQSGLTMRPTGLEKHSSASLCFSNVIATCDCSLSL